MSASTSTPVTTLTDRYVDAVVRRLPLAQRADVGRELRASIEDAVEARLDAQLEADGSAADPGRAEREALTELGDPERLAARYAGGPNALIGPGSYFDYLRVLRLLLVPVPALAAAVSVLADLVESPQTVASVISSAVFAALLAAVQVGFWTTLGFAIAERRGATMTPAGQGWTPDRLPKVVDRRIGLGETALGIGTLVLTISLIVSERLNPLISDPSGTRIPFFRSTLWNGWVWYFVVVLVAMIALQVTNHLAGRWTARAALVNLGLELAFGLPAVWLLLTDRLVDPAAQEALRLRLGWEQTPINLQAVAVAVAVVVLVTIGQAFLAARRHARPR